MSDTGDHHHYFDDRPAVADVRSSFTVESPRGTLHLESASGVFARKGLDRGTSVFLEITGRMSTQPPPPGSDLCDLGCGSGVLALVMAATYPECTVHAIDVNERARSLCAENARRNNLDNVVVSSPELIDPAVRFHLLWSNPPIRIGKPAVHALLDQWLDRLDAQGRAELVIARNLGADSLSEWMTQRGYVVERLGSSKGFRVLRVTRGPDRIESTPPS